MASLSASAELPVIQINDVSALPTGCQECGVCRTSKIYCLAGEGSPDAQIVFLGEGPGEHEEETGLPFQGRAGWILERALREVGLYRAEAWVTNALRCRAINAAGGNRAPTTAELTHCRPFLDVELAALPNLKVIVALGASALWACLGDDMPTGGVLENQGKTFWSSRYNCWVVATVHPAWVLRKPGEAIWLSWDMKKAMLIAEHGRPAALREPTYRVVHTLADAQEMRAELLQAPYLVWDWETGPGVRGDALHPVYAHGFCVSFSGRADFAWVVPRYGANFSPIWSRHELPQLDAILREIFLSSVPKIGHHVAFDFNITVSTLRVRPVNVVGDTMLAHHLLNNHLNERAHGLKRVSDMFTVYGRYDDEIDTWLTAHGYTKQGKPDGAYIYKVDNEILWKYNAIDSIVPWLVHPLLEAQLRAADLWEVYVNERIPLALEYADMDRHGVPMSLESLEEMSRDIGSSMEAVRSELGRQVLTWRCKVHGRVFAKCCDKATGGEKVWETTEAGVRVQSGSLGEPLNPNSHDQISRYLFDTLNLPVLARTDTGAPSTKEEVLREYAAIVPLIITPILHYRAYSKLKGTYVDGKSGAGGIKAALDPDGYARMSTLLHVVETFRLATRKPLPIHLIPRPLVVFNCGMHGRYLFVRCCELALEESLNIRGVVRPHSENDCLVAADYKQEEYGLAAIASFQQDLEEAIFDRGEDVHEFVMHLMSGRSKRDFQDANGRWLSKTAADEYKNLRSFWKSINFMILYRGGAAHLAASLGIAEDEAERLIYEYYERLPMIQMWQYRVIKALRETGRVVGLFKTYRILANASSPYRRDRTEAERAACNQPFQDGGAHVLARAIIRVGARLRKERFPGRMLFSVHDELVCVSRRDLVEDMKVILTEEMTRPHPELVGACGVARGIPIDITVSQEWGGPSLEAAA